MHRNFSLHMWQAAGGWAVLLSHMRVEDFSPLCTPTKRALSLPNDPLTMLREIIALWAIWTLLCPFLRLTVTWLKIFLDEMIDETFFVRLSVISRSKARFDQCKITKTSSRSSEAVSRKTSLSLIATTWVFVHFCNCVGLLLSSRPYQLLYIPGFFIGRFYGG